MVRRRGEVLREKEQEKAKARAEKMKQVGEVLVGVVGDVCLRFWLWWVGR